MRLDLRKQRLSASGQFEGVDFVAFVDGHDDSVRLADDPGNITLGLPLLSTQPLRPKRVHRLLGQLSGHVLPAQQRPHPGPRRIQTFLRRHGSHDCVAVDAGPVGARGVVQEFSRRSARLSRGRSRVCAEHHVAKVAVIGDVLG